MCVLSSVFSFEETSGHTKILVMLHSCPCGTPQGPPRAHYHRVEEEPEIIMYSRAKDDREKERH